MFNETTVSGRRMNLILTVLGIVLIIFFAALTLRAFGGGKGQGVYGMDMQNTITVAGKGEVIVMPDIAEVNFSVLEQGATVNAAQDKATEKMNKAIDAVKAQGVDDRDIKTSDYSAYPRYEYAAQVCNQYGCPPSGSPKIAGYEVRQTISVKIRKIEDAGKILGIIGGAGVSEVSGLNFTVDNEDEKIREARKIAIDDAREQAKQLAKDLGVKLGDIVSFNESGNYPIPMYYAKDMAMGMGGSTEESPRVPTGENKISSNVTIVYEIK